MREVESVPLLSVSRETPYVHAMIRIEGELDPLTTVFRIVVSPLDLFGFVMDAMHACDGEKSGCRNVMYLRFHADKCQMTPSLPSFLVRFDQDDLADPEAIDAACGSSWAQCQEWWSELNAKREGS